MTQGERQPPRNSGYQERRTAAGEDTLNALGAQHCGQLPDSACLRFIPVGCLPRFLRQPSRRACNSAAKQLDKTQKRTQDQRLRS